MSTTTIATTSVGGYSTARDTTVAGKPAKGFFRRLFDSMVASREAEANRLIQKYIATLSEQERKDLGYPAGGDLGQR